MMYRLFRFALFVCLFTTLVACAVSAAPQPNTPNPIISTSEPEPAGPQPVLLQASVERATPNLSVEVLQSQGAANNAFALEFYTTARSEQQGNFVFSPYSIRTAFGMVFAGARGTTEAQMADVLHFDLPQTEFHPALNGLDIALTTPASPTDTLRLNIANAAWAEEEYPFLPDYLNLLGEHYGAGVYTVDYKTIEARAASRDLINGWLSEKTEHKIPELIPEGLPEEGTVLILTNAIYFQADWDTPFDPANTTDFPFTQLDGTQVQIPMMSDNIPIQHTLTDNWEAIGIPYQNGKWRMVAVMPSDFATFEQALTPTTISEIFTTLEQYDAGEQPLVFPKFDSEGDFDLSETLIQMGMPNLFDESLADLSGMDGTDRLLVTDALHKATITVDEVGTVATAATAVIVGIESAPEPVVFDHPFLYFIQDTATGTILFMGRMVEGN